MKRILALSLAVLMIAALFCACGEKSSEGTDNKANADSVKTVVNPKYDEGVAEQYAKNVTTDENGNKVYEFDNASYKSFTQNYNNKVSAAITNDVVKTHDTSFGQYCYINDDKKAVIIGVNPGKYDQASAEKEAEGLAQKAFAYFQNLQPPVDTVYVIYCNCNNQDEEYGKFEFKVE